MVYHLNLPWLYVYTIYFCLLVWDRVSLYSLGWPWSPFVARLPSNVRSFCLSLLNSMITGICHHTPVHDYILYSLLFILEFLIAFPNLYYLTMSLNFSPQTRFDQLFGWLPFLNWRVSFLGLCSRPPFWTGCSVCLLHSCHPGTFLLYFSGLDFQLDFILTPVTDWFQFFFFLVAYIPIRSVTKEILKSKMCFQEQSFKI